ncbi:MAG: SLC13 family permease [bacterium]|nr:SLC13/DASS family transporter [Myxococcales bacterium]MCB9550594.1 SLC13/DASS family transporter [Myxococcales bacterium]
MTPEIVTVLAVLGVATLLFVTEWIRYDVTAIAVTTVLLVTGILDLEAALSGLSNPATVAIAAMLVLSAGLRETGALRPLVDAIERLGARSRTLALILILVSVLVASAFINNTAVVVLFIPVAIELAPRLGEDASRLLMPISFVSIVGGICTLIGTSTNLIVSAIGADHGMAPIGMFEMLPVGAAIAAAGVAYVFIARRWLRSRRGDADLAERYDIEAFIADVQVGDGAAICGLPLAAIREIEGVRVDALELFRRGSAVFGGVVTPGDTVRLRAMPGALAEILRGERYRPATPPRWRDADADDDPAAESPDTLVEIVITSSADIAGRRLREVDFLGRFGAVPLAIRQRSALRHVELGGVRLRTGDSLLLNLPVGRHRELRRSGLFIVSEVDLPRPRRGAWIATAIMVAVVAATALGLLSAAASTLCGALLMVLTRCLGPEQVYEAIDWKIIMLLAGVIPLGVAMEQTGAAAWLAGGVLSQFADLGPHAIILGVFLVTNLLTNFISNAAAAALMTPLALEAASLFAIDARPLLLTVAFSASLSFVTPIGYQTNTLIYGPGNYRFVDYLKLGGPLTLICAALITALVPIVWPLTPTP